MNIQTFPEGAKFLVVSRDYGTVLEGASPHYDPAFPTGNYRVCFELDGYVTEWQDAAVSTYGSCWVGPVMTPARGAAPPSCRDQGARLKAERDRLRSAVLQSVLVYGGAPAAQASPGAPAGTTRTVIHGDHEDDEDDAREQRREALEDVDKERVKEIRGKVQERRAAPR